MPTRKVGSGVLAAALVTLIVWGLAQFAAITLPGDVAAALTLLVGFGISYLVPEADPAES